MSIKITCPPSAATPDIANNDCGVRFGQITRLLFERAAGGGFVDETTIITTLALDAKLSASDDTKVQFTPRTENVVIPAQDVTEEGGGDNTTIEGSKVILGGQNITVTGRYRDISLESVEGLKMYDAEAVVYGALTVYVVDEFGQVWGKQSGGTGTAVTGIPISSLFHKAPSSEGYNTSTFTEFMFDFPQDYYKDLIMVTPADYDAKTKPNP